jgi:hypothetical protein
MAASNPPTEYITSFNSSLFNQPQVNLTQSQADLLYLSKTTSGTSTAGNTTFTGTINSTIINTVNSTTVSLGSTVSAQVRTVNVGIGNSLIGNDNVILGYGSTAGGSFCVAIGRSSTTNYYLQSTAIGANTSVLYDNSTALGYGATATASNQVVLGRSTETVIIPNQISFSKSAYSFPFSSSQIQGYYSLIVGSSTSLTTATTTNILAPSIPIGVWRIDFSIQMTADTAGTITNSRSVVSNTTASLSPLPYAGSSLRSHVSEVYAIGDIQILNGSFTLTQSTAGIIYLNVLRTFATGTFSCIGTISTTRIA